MNRSSLSVGDVVSAGLRIYRDRFQVYFPIALMATVWSIVPIYGWAKYATATGLISRLAFAEITGKPETVTEASNRVNPRLWTFFAGGLFFLLIFLGFYLGGRLAFIILAMILSAIGNSNPVINFLLVFPLLIAFFVGLIWLFTRLSLVELPIALENVNANTAISRSWLLTQQFVGRLQLIFGVAFLITIPLSLIANIVTGIIQGFLALILGADSLIYTTLMTIISITFNIGFTGLIMPFWQSIKAVIYYDLRSRREGIDLL